MKYFFVLLLLISLFYSCSEGTSETPEILLREKIANMEDSIGKLTVNLAPGEMLSDEVSLELIDLLLDYYHKYPKDVYAPECLDKVHMTYSAIGRYKYSANYADTLLANYPDYINREMILESQAGAYDVYLQPRDTAKVRYYYELLLKENKDLPKDKVHDIQWRLNNLDKTMEEIIMSKN